MKLQKKRGFTLLEILVAVLIIGILAAVAVPQYQKAVLKSRFSSLMPIATAIAEGNEVYYMTNNSYTTDPAQLDIAGKAAYPEGTNLTLNVANDYTYVMATRDDLKKGDNPQNKYIVYQKHSNQYPDNIHCEALKDDTQANWLCGTALKGTPISGSLEEEYKTYILKGSAEDGYFGTTYIDGTNGKSVNEGDKCVATGEWGCSGSVVNAGGVCEVQEGTSTRGCPYLKADGGTCIGTAPRSCQTQTDGGGAGYYKNKATCEGIGSSACTASKYDNSTCIGTGKSSCSSGNYQSRFENNSLCEGSGKESCTFAKFTDSTCEGYADNACSGGAYRNSTCYGYEYRSCSASLIGTPGGQFENSTCHGIASNSCFGYNFDNSTCNGSGNTSCSYATFSNGSKCYMRGTGACQNNTYNDTSCCVSDVANGYICPDHECK